MKKFDEWFNDKHGIHRNNGLIDLYKEYKPIWQAAQEVQRDSFENDINLAFINVFGNDDVESDGKSYRAKLIINAIRNNKVV